MREGRRLGSIPRDQLHLTGMDSLDDAGQVVEIHRLLKTVFDCLPHERVVGYLAVALDVLETGCGIGEHGGQHVVRLHSLKLRWYFSAAPASQHGERNSEIPAPTRLEHGCIQQRLHQDVTNRLRMQIPEYILQGERVLRTERQQQTLFCRRRLQLEVELPAKSLSQR